MPRKLRFVIGGLLVVIASGVVSYAVSASVASAALPAGATRYAVAGAMTGSPDSTTSTTFVALSGLSTTVKIPSGKRGDVMGLVCAEAGAAGDFANIVVTVNNVDAQPGEITLREGTSSQPEESHCASFFKTGLGAGTKTVKVWWRSVNGGEIHAYARSMIVFVNVR